MQLNEITAPKHNIIYADTKQRTKTQQALPLMLNNGMMKGQYENNEHSLKGPTCI